MTFDLPLTLQQAEADHRSSQSLALLVALLALALLQAAALLWLLSDSPVLFLPEPGSGWVRP